MRLYRLTFQMHRGSVLSGHGSSTFEGARWNSPGVPVAYAASSGSLAYLEVLAHTTSFGVLHRQPMAWFVYELEDPLIAELDPEDVPASWQSNTDLSSTQALGTRFLHAREFAALAVPSVLVPFERNFVINPLHPAIPQLQPREEIPLTKDPRLLTPLEATH